MFCTLKATGAKFWLEALNSTQKRMSHDQTAIVPSMRKKILLIYGITNSNLYNELSFLCSSRARQNPKSGWINYRPYFISRKQVWMFRVLNHLCNKFIEAHTKNRWFCDALRHKNMFFVIYFFPLFFLIKRHNQTDKKVSFNENCFDEKNSW